jgi:LacI family transcriptional regulator
VTPSLTTIRQDIPAKAEAAVRTLLGMIDGDPATDVSRMGVELVARGTVAPPPSSRA